MTNRLILVSHGEYSDYTVNALLKWETTREPDAMLDEFLATDLAKQAEKNYTMYSTFIAWLTRQPGIEEITYDELHLGDYASIDRPLKFRH